MEVTSKNEVRAITWDKKTFAAKRATLPIDQLKDFFGQAYGEIYSGLAAKGKQGLQPFAIYYSVDPGKKTTELAAAVVVNDPVELPGCETITIPSGKALLITHYGPYETMTASYDALERHLAKNKLQKGWMLEEYLSDPQAEKDPANWKTNIYCILK